MTGLQCCLIYNTIFSHDVRYSQKFFKYFLILSNIVRYCCELFKSFSFFTSALLFYIIGYCLLLTLLNIASVLSHTYCDILLWVVRYFVILLMVWYRKSKKLTLVQLCRKKNSNNNNNCKKELSANIYIDLTVIFTLL